MAESINAAVQTIAPNANAVFQYNTCTCRTSDVTNRVGSGTFTLKGNCCNGCCCDKEFYISFMANIAVPTGQTPQAISVALTLNGEPLGESTATVTPGATEGYFSVAVQKTVIVPRCSNYTISVRNTSPIPINMRNANLSIK